MARLTVLELIERRIKTLQEQYALETDQVERKIIDARIGELLYLTTADVVRKGR